MLDVIPSCSLPVRRAEQNELEQYFASNYLITLPYHSAYWIGYQARTWGVNNFIPLDRWAAGAWSLRAGEPR
jgi:hypothetical protein